MKREIGICGLLRNDYFSLIKVEIDNFPPHTISKNYNCGGTVTKTALASWLLLAARLLSKAKATLRIVSGSRNSDLRCQNG